VHSYPGQGTKYAELVYYFPAQTNRFVVAFKFVKIIVFLAEIISIKISGRLNGKFIVSLKE
jgi:hypothetical protein